jgi:hypothetical protein
VLFPTLKTLCADDVVRREIYTSRWSMASAIADSKGVSKTALELLKLGAGLASVEMENAPPLFESAASRKPGIKKVAVVLDRALDLMSRAEGMSLDKALEKR